MNEKLKPCPFCGGEADLENNAIKSEYCDSDTLEVTVNEWNEEPYIYWVRCEECDAQGKVAYSEQEAVKAWNRRYKENETD